MVYAPIIVDSTMVTMTTSLANAVVQLAALAQTQASLLPREWGAGAAGAAGASASGTVSPYVCGCGAWVWPRAGSAHGAGWSPPAEAATGPTPAKPPGPPSCVAAVAEAATTRVSPRPDARTTADAVEGSGGSSEEGHGSRRVSKRAGEAAACRSGRPGRDSGRPARPGTSCRNRFAIFSGESDCEVSPAAATLDGVRCGPRPADGGQGACASGGCSDESGPADGGGDSRDADEASVSSEGVQLGDFADVGRGRAAAGWPASSAFLPRVAIATVGRAVALPRGRRGVGIRARARATADARPDAATPVGRNAEDAAAFGQRTEQGVVRGKPRLGDEVAWQSYGTVEATLYAAAVASPPFVFGRAKCEGEGGDAGPSLEDLALWQEVSVLSEVFSSQGHCQRPEGTFGRGCSFSSLVWVVKPLLSAPTSRLNAAVDAGTSCPASGGEVGNRAVRAHSAPARPDATTRASERGGPRPVEDAAAFGQRSEQGVVRGKPRLGDEVAWQCYGTVVATPPAAAAASPPFVFGRAKCEGEGGDAGPSLEDLALWQEVSVLSEVFSSQGHCQRPEGTFGRGCSFSSLVWVVKPLLSAPTSRLNAAVDEGTSCPASGGEVGNRAGRAHSVPARPDATTRASGRGGPRPVEAHLNRGGAAAGGRAGAAAAAVAQLACPGRASSHGDGVGIRAEGPTVPARPDAATSVEGRNSSAAGSTAPEVPARADPAAGVGGADKPQGGPTEAGIAGASHGGSERVRGKASGRAQTPCVEGGEPPSGEEGAAAAHSACSSDPAHAGGASESNAGAEGPETRAVEEATEGSAYLGGVTSGGGERHEGVVTEVGHAGDVARGGSTTSAEVARAHSTGSGGGAEASPVAKAGACAVRPEAFEAADEAEGGGSPSEAASSSGEEQAGGSTEVRHVGEALAPSGSSVKATPKACGPVTPTGGAGGPAAGRVSGLRRVIFARRGLRDLDSVDLPLASQRGSVTEADFSQNCLTKLGVRQVVEFCRSCDGLEVLKLFRCGLPDEAAPAVAGFLLQHARVKAVHLSHNLFTATGAALLVGAAANAEREKDDVIWLRLERNSIANPASFLRSAEARWSVCPRSAGCTQHTCLFGNRVHLPFLDAEREDADTPCHWGRWVALRAPRGSASAGTSLATRQISWQPRPLGSERA